MTLNQSRITGKERDTETGLDYFGARYYGSTMGRFTSPDPKMFSPQRLYDPQQWNRYSYTRNNPIIHVDPDGMELRLATGGWAKGDRERVKQDLIQRYRTPEGRKAINTLRDTPTKWAIKPVDLHGEDYGKTTSGPVRVNTTTGKAVSADPSNMTGTIGLDFNRLRADQQKSRDGMPVPENMPASDKALTDHELAHAVNQTIDPVGSFNQTQAQAEAAANQLAQSMQNSNTNKPDMSEKEAAAAVDKILDEKKKKD